MSSVTLPQAAILDASGTRETWCRRVLLVASAIAVIALVCHFALMLWAQHEFSSPESVVAAQSTMLAREGTLYYSLRDYPYTVSAYMPSFYLLEAALIKAGLPAYLAGRLISFAALLGIFAMVWRILMIYTRHRYYAWTGLILCVSTSLVLSWGTVGQVDTLGGLFCHAGLLLLFSLPHPGGEYAWDGCRVHHCRMFHETNHGGLSGRDLFLTVVPRS